jgi:predicted alpha-1,6-mannanase (GH76 family)
MGMVATIVGLGLLAGPGTSSAATTPASASIATLMESYDAKSGRIGGGWWTGAVALSTVMTYRQATGDSQYDYAITEAWEKNKSGNFTNEYLDDTGWWALVWLQAYDITGNGAYLQMAQTDAAYMRTYWDSQCGGGIYWSTAKAYKASIANELFLAVTAGLHNRLPGDTTFLGWANDEWSWFNGSGLLSSNLVKDGLYVAGCTFNNANLTYNQGVVLHGLSELAKATGNAGPLASARSIATAAVHRFNKNGVLYDGCEPNCAGDFQSFKGIFIRYLRGLAKTVNTTEYDGFMTTTANSILANDTNSAGQQGNSFVGPFALWTYNTQATAAEALVAAAVPGTAPPAAQPAGPPTRPAAATTSPASKMSASASPSGRVGSPSALATQSAAAVNGSGGPGLESGAPAATGAGTRPLATLAAVSAVSVGLFVAGAGLLLRWRRLSRA